jgi:ketosteroid isomerase-like protein
VRSQRCHVRRTAASRGSRHRRDRETWPPFFEWLKRGAAFELASLDVTAGESVAYAHGLLRCGSRPAVAERPPELRLTLGLRKERGRWMVAHEHHSFPATSEGDGGGAD